MECLKHSLHLGANIHKTCIVGECAFDSGSTFLYKHLYIGCADAQVMKLKSRITSCHHSWFGLLSFNLKAGWNVQLGFRTIPIDMMKYWCKFGRTSGMNIVLDAHNMNNYQIEAHVRRYFSTQAWRTRPWTSICLMQNAQNAMIHYGEGKCHWCMRRHSRKGMAMRGTHCET